MKKITPFLWFDNQAEEAVSLYTSLFPNSKVGEITRYPEDGPGPAGTVMTVDFELNGQEFTALNGGPEFKFTEAVSFVVHCEDQAEVDRYWNALSDGGEQQPCGWVKDRYGLSWQVVPTVLFELLQHPDPEKAQRVMQTMLQMKKIEIQPLQEAAA